MFKVSKFFSITIAILGTLLFLIITNLSQDGSINLFYLILIPVITPIFVFVVVHILEGKRSMKLMLILTLFSYIFNLTYLLLFSGSFFGPTWAIDTGSILFILGAFVILILGLAGLIMIRVKNSRLGGLLMMASVLWTPPHILICWYLLGFFDSLFWEGLVSIFPIYSFIFWVPAFVLALLINIAIFRKRE